MDLKWLIFGLLLAKGAIQIAAFALFVVAGLRISRLRRGGASGVTSRKLLCSFVSKRATESYELNGIVWPLRGGMLLLVLSLVWEVMIGHGLGFWR